MADANAEKHHDYHLVDPSPWPALGSLAAFVLAIGTVMYFTSAKAGDPSLMYLYPGLALVVATMFFWWRDVIREAHKGDHTPVVQLHLRYGMIMFIASEVMFFVAWFWAYFDVALFPSGCEYNSGNSESADRNDVQRDNADGWSVAAGCQRAMTRASVVHIRSVVDCRLSIRSSCSLRAQLSRGRTTRCWKAIARASYGD